MAIHSSTIAWKIPWKDSVAHSRLTLCDPMDYNLPSSSVHGIVQARIMEQVAIPSSRDNKASISLQEACLPYFL